MSRQVRNQTRVQDFEKLSLFQRFGLFFYDRRETTLVFWLALMVFGALCYSTLMVRQGFPNVDVPISVVSGTYFVNNKAKVDADVTKPASELIMSLPEVETVTTQAGDNFFTALVQYKESVSSASGGAAVERALKSKLPKTAQLDFRPVEAAKFAEQSDLLIAVYSQDESIQKLQTRAENAAKELQANKSVASAKLLKQFETGTNPLTGKTATEQRNFDRIGFRENGQTVYHQAATIGVVASEGTGAAELSNEVQQTLAKLQGKEGVHYKIAADFAPDIEHQISGLQQSLLEGLVAVLLLCFLLISWRASLTSALAMITVLLVTIALLYLIGYTLNTVTLFALILSLGLIVDDTIIKVEAVDAARTESRRKRDIIALAAKRVSRASAAGTLTTMLAFAPMLFISGVLGDFIRLLPVTIIISLALSLLVSLTLVPILASDIILHKHPKKTRNPILRLESVISNGLSRLLLVGNRSRPKGIAIGTVALLIGVGAVAASTIYFKKLKFDIFPATKDSDAIRMVIRFKPGTSIAQAQTIVDRLDTQLAQTAGDTLERVTYQNTGSLTDATADVTLTRFQDREQTSPELVDELNRQFGSYPDAIVRVSQVNVGPPADDLPFKLQIYSEQQAPADRLARDVAVFLQGREIERVNGTKAHVTEVQVEGQAAVTRIDSKKTVEVLAGFDADDTSALVTVTKTAIEQAFPAERVRSYGLPSDALAFDFGAESENQDSFKTMLVAFPILLVAMYLLMALEFRSFLQPLLIFIAIPFSFFGVAFGLDLTDNPLSFFVLVGFFALIGIALNNTILLTDYANQARDAGENRVEAIATAVRARFRPLITTSFTSVVALLPLALNDPFWESLSYTLVFGLLSSTFLVLVTFPYVYLAGEALRIFGHRLWIRDLPQVIQYPADVLIAPIRVIAFVLYIVFHHKPAKASR